jgi:hypothetical protein
VDPHGQAAETPSDYITWQLSLYYFSTQPSLVSGASLIWDSFSLGVPFLPGFGGYLQASDDVLKKLGEVCKFDKKDKVVVIGETGERVQRLAEAIGAKFYNPRNEVTVENLKQSIKNNWQWLRRKYKEGYLIIDSGFDKERKVRGFFYQLEQKWLKQWRANDGK